MTYTERLRKKLQSFRQFHGLSLRDMAKKIGTTAQTLCNLEKGRGVNYETGRLIEDYVGPI